MSQQIMIGMLVAVFTALLTYYFNNKGGEKRVNIMAKNFEKIINDNISLLSYHQEVLKMYGDYYILLY